MESTSLQQRIEKSKNITHFSIVISACIMMLVWGILALPPLDLLVLGIFFLLSYILAELKTQTVIMMDEELPNGNE